MIPWIIATAICSAPRIDLSHESLYDLCASHNFKHLRTFRNRKDGSGFDGEVGRIYECSRCKIWVVVSTMKSYKGLHFWDTRDFLKKSCNEILMDRILK